MDRPRIASAKWAFPLVGLQVAFASLLVGIAVAGLPSLGVALVACAGSSALLLFAGTIRGGDIVASRHGRLTQVSRMRDEADGFRRTALYDAELGVYQSWYFELRLREEIERCRRYGENMTVLVLKVLPDALGEDDLA